MASHEETPILVTDKNVDLDNNSVSDSSSTINITTDSEKSISNITVDITDDDSNVLNYSTENGDVDQPSAINLTGKNRTTEVFSFVGAEYSRDEDSPFPGEPPIKRPHSPEKLEPDNIKRKCEKNDTNLNDTLLSLGLNESTAAEDRSSLSVSNTSWVPPLPAGDWPVTVTRLLSPSGGEVFLVGTAHFSRESQEDVAKVIQAVRPHIVTVELCKARINLLQLDEKTILEEAKNINFAKIRATVQQNGLFNGLMYILLLTMSAHLTKELGMAPGGEFRRAFQEARKIPNCSVHLGDRPINITLQRALASLTWWQTTKLTWHILTSKDPISKEEVEKCKQKDLLEEMLAEMTGEFPALSYVFVHERDLYLAHSLALAAQPVPTPYGVEPAKVVGVVGIGHVPGIVAHWGKVGEEDITPILRVPPQTMTSKVIKFTMKASAVGLVLWGAYKILPVPRLPAISQIFK